MAPVTPKYFSSREQFYQGASSDTLDSHTVGNNEPEQLYQGAPGNTIDSHEATSNEPAQLYQGAPSNTIDSHTAENNDPTQLYQGAPSEVVDSHAVGNTDPENSGKTKRIVSRIQGRMLQCGTKLSKLKLEIVAFLFTFSFVMTKISSTTMILDKVCLVHYGYPSFVCENLENYTKIKNSVERLATNYQLGHTLIQTAPAAVLACFVGPWSDHHGRKFPVIVAISGMILDSIGSTVCAYFLETRVEYYFIPALFTGILGGPVSILAVVYSYASDTTPFAKRTMKYAFLEIASGFAMPVGAMAGGWIYKFLGYPAVFFFATGGLLLSLIWVMFVLKETTGLDNDDPWSVKLKKLFSCKTFWESFTAVAKARPHQGRKQVILLIISMCFLVITINCKYYLLLCI